MKKLLPLICCMLFFATTKAQYVNIPDSNFRKFLIGKYPSCFNGAGQMDTLCIDTISRYDNIIVANLNIKNIDGIEYLKNITSLNCSSNQLTNLSKLPFYLRKLNCMSNLIDSLDNIGDFLVELDCSFNNLTSLPKLTTLNDSLKVLNCSFNKINNLPNLPQFLTELNCGFNELTNLPILPQFLTLLWCSENQLTTLPPLPNSLETLDCSSNNLTSLPPLPNSLTRLDCYFNKLTKIPNIPILLNVINCSNNLITHIPNFHNSQKYIVLNCFNNNMYCLPLGNPNAITLVYDTTKIKCVPYQGIILKPSGLLSVVIHPPICNPINNPNHCQSFPSIQSFAYTDLNNNNKLDVNELPKHNLKLTLSNNTNSYTNTNGVALLNTDSLGSYTITATPPNLYKAVPSNYTHNFSTYDTLVTDTFALQAIVLKDSIAIKLTPTNWFARAGRAYPYLVSYENVGTTVLSNAVVSLQYDNSLLNYDSSSVGGVANSGSNLSLNIGNLLPGQSGSFIAYFTVKPNAVLNNSFVSIANITTNSVSAVDTVKSIIRGSYDPNDKQATPSLTLQDVSDGKNIDYTIRFQNTGTDTAFNVVIADTLDSKLDANQVQIVGSSHTCKTGVRGNIIFFEFLDIMLPDSNVNKFGSNGFVSFKIKPISSVVAGTIIPNKAAIYFDYNSPVITKPANTIIQNPLPLQLLNFSAIPQKETDKILVYWNTANEVNTAYFIIETSSNGINFKSVAEVAAKGIGSNSYFYSIDKATVVYVRLKMVDKNGIFTYSNTIKLSSTVKEYDGLMVLQNPVKHQLKLNVVSTKLNKTNASLVNTQGKIVKRFILQQGHQTIDISGIAAGVYYLQSNEGSKKVVVE